MAADLNERDTKLVQWLQEAHAKEAELEVDLTAHIGLTQKQAYKNRLRRHLTETRDHKRRVAARIKQLGGSVAGGPIPTTVAEAAGKTVATIKGQVGALRAALSEQAETHLRNVQEELREEHVEIALYSRIATFATEVGDRDTAALATSIRRDEERMSKYLDAELTRLVKDVVRAHVPREQRRQKSARSRSGRNSRSTSSATTTRRRTTTSGARRKTTTASR